MIQNGMYRRDNNKQQRGPIRAYRVRRKNQAGELLLLGLD